MKKSLKIIAGASAAALTAAAGASCAAGAYVHRNIISEKVCRINPEKVFANSFYLKRYVNNPVFREAEDWFCGESRDETVIYNSRNEKLKANIIKAEKPSHIWVILVHGLRATPRFLSKQGHHYYKKGYNTLFPIQRGHGTSEFRSCSLGYFERLDVIEWIKYIISLDSEAKIILHGTSMGAATVMMTTGEKLPENVIAAVSDCGYTDCYYEFLTQIKTVLDLPSFPFVDMARLYTIIFHGWDFKACSPIRAVAKAEVPILFIHGEKDKFVPFGMMEKLYKACSSEKDFLSVPDAHHDESCERHPKLYWGKTDSFIEKYL